MNLRTILFATAAFIILIGCAGGIPKEDRQILRTDSTAVLIEGIQMDDYLVKTKAIDAMRDIEDPSFVPALTEALYYHDDIVVMKAARALGAIGDTTTIPGLEFTLKFDPNFSAQKAAAVALYRLGKKEEALKFIKEGLQDESSFKRSMVLNELTFARSDDFLPMYIDMLKDSTGSVRDDAINAIALLNNKEAVPPLMDALRDSFLLIRADAIITISQIGDTSQIREAMQITSDEIDKMENGDLDSVIEFNEYKLDLYKNLRASTLLVELNDTTYLGYLYDESMAPMNPMSILSTIILANWGDETAVQMVGDFLNHDDVNIRESVIQILGEVHKDWAWQYIIEATKDTDDEVRETAVQLLQYYDEKEVKETLLELLNDPNPNIQIEAALSLNELGNKQGVYILQPLLGNDDWYIRINAARAILLILKTI